MSRLVVAALVLASGFSLASAASAAPLPRNHPPAATSRTVAPFRVPSTVSTTPSPTLCWNTYVCRRQNQPARR